MQGNAEHERSTNGDARGKAGPAELPITAEATWGHHISAARPRSDVRSRPEPVMNHPRAAFCSLSSQNKYRLTISKPFDQPTRRLHNVGQNHEGARTSTTAIRSTIARPTGDGHGLPSGEHPNGDR